jgi:hypothetical protein
VRDGDYARARELRDEIVEDHGDVEAGEEFAFLDALAACDWGAPDLPALLAGWRAVDVELGRSHWRRPVADRHFLRLMELFGVASILEADEASLPLLFNALQRDGQPVQARDVLRDALLAGIAAPPRELVDPECTDLLREPLEARWLACLGALRRLWAAPRLDDRELEALAAELPGSPLPEDDDSRALDFWRCLRVVLMGRSAPEPLRHAARARTKRLDPELHAQVMRLA